jgi:hypothetical protein
MTTPPPSLDRRTLADLTARLAQARPEAIRAVVALIDRMPERGDADALIAPIRPRLMLMRDMIRRPASLGRVLIHPIEDLLVPPDEWRRGSLSVPRSVTPVAIALATEALPTRTRQDIIARLSGATMDDAQAIQAVGETLWPQAAAAFANAATGKLPAGLALPMREADLRGILAAMGETLRIAPALARVLGTSPRGSVPAWERIEHGLRDVLADAASLSADCFARTGLILMRRFMAAGPVVSLLRDAANRAASGAAEHRLAAALDSFLAELPAQMPEPASLALLPHPVQQTVVAEAVATVERAGNEIGTWQAERRENLREVQARVIAVIRRRVQECLETELLPPLARLRDDGLPTAGGQAAIEALEAAARAASAMVSAARRLGPADDLSLALRRAAEDVAAMAEATPAGAPGDMLGRTDLARIVEIMAGPDAAERVLTPAA